MSEPTHNDDHWRRLAAELGLDVGPAPEQPAEPPAAEAPPPQVHSQLPDHTEPASFGRRGRSEPIREFGSEPAEEAFPPEEVEESPSRSRRGRPGPPPPERGGLFEDDSPVAAEAEIEGSDVEAAAVPEVRPDEAEEASDEVVDEQSGKRRRRRRPRRKKKVGEAVAEDSAESAGDSALVESPTANDDDEEEPTAEVVRNWNVPSWDDLIGSLHRPER